MDDPTPTLSEFGINLSQLARDGKLSSIDGIDRYVDRVIQVLCRRARNNALLIYESGIDPIAILEGLARRIVDLNVPDSLKPKQLFSLDLSLLLSASKDRSEFERRFQQILAEIRSAGNIILFIDNFQSSIVASMANILIPPLARYHLQCIGVTTAADYFNYIERDAALERRFQPIKIGELNIDRL